ncbi:MAG: LuxR C-terminal-related transcriptional regulator [Paramuribaculum sp.]|nr:LuxR C-terminal-related transcriptional regulator [Paramuribaculum sp.]
MSHLTLTVSHSSPVVAAGLIRIFSQMRDLSLSVTSVDVSSLSTYLADNATDVVLLDPLSVGADPASLLTERSISTPQFIAVSTSLLPLAITRAYDAVVSIYDNVETFKELLTRISADTSEESDSVKELSPRERDVVIGVVKGLSNKEIASEMNVSTNTVMTHRRNIASKLQIHSVAGLTIYAIVSKLVKLEDLQPQG